MKVQDHVALVTGANRGLGAALVQALLARGAAKVYAASRDGGPVTGAVPLRLDVTDGAQIAAAAHAAGDVSLLVNNAGISRGSSLLGATALDAARAELETNVLGPIATSQAFAPVLARHGGGAIINVLSVLSWITIPGAATYSMSKAAAWSATNGLRNELRGQATQVLGVHVGYMNTDMAKQVLGDKLDPARVAAAILDALEAGERELLVDAVSQQVKQGLATGVYLRER